MEAATEVTVTDRQESPNNNGFVGRWQEEANKKESNDHIFKF
jgi:hypothetical protein